MFYVPNWLDSGQTFSPHSAQPRLFKESARIPRKVDVRLPGKGNSNTHGARPVHLIITMIKWIRISRLSINNSLSSRILRRHPCQQGFVSNLLALSQSVWVSSLLGPGCFPLQSGRICTTHPACQLEKSPTVNANDAEKCGAVPRRARI